MPLPGAPTISRPSAGQSQVSGQSAGTGAASVAAIPFTRAARKKSRKIGDYGPYVLGAGTQQLPPIQIPANGYIRRLILDVTATAAGNAATVAFQNDAPFNVVQSLSVQAANGDSLWNPLDGFAWYAVHKYGAFNCNGAKDPLWDPTYSRTTGAGATGGSFHFQLEIPFEFDARDGAGALPNMAANQSFQLNLILNTLGQIYSTAPTAAPSVSISITAEYWAAPAETNAQGVPQQTAPRNNLLVSQVLTANPVVVPNTDQTIQLPNVGNVIRWLLFIARGAGGARTDADWPTVMQLLVNNDMWNYLTKNNWRRAMAIQYGMFGGVATAPTVNQLDTGVWCYTEFMNDGSAGDNEVSSAANRDLMLVTGSGTALNIEAQNWGAGIASLQVITNSLKVPDTSSFYAPFVI